MPFEFDIRKERLATYNHEPSHSKENLHVEHSSEEKHLWCVRCHDVFTQNVGQGAVCPTCGWHVGS